MNELQIFENDEFGKVRTVVIDNEPWMVGKDVADALGYANSRDAISKHVDDEDKGVAKCDTLGGKQDLQIINESGMYDLVFGSKLPTAKKFKHWVTSEVIPALRKTGSYTMPKMSKELQAIVMLDGKQEKLREEFEDFKGEIPLLQRNARKSRALSARSAFRRWVARKHQCIRIGHFVAVSMETFSVSLNASLMFVGMSQSIDHSSQLPVTS